MSENTSAQKRSFFGDYFRYNLRTQRGFTILFAILNFFSTVCLSVGIYLFAKYVLVPISKGEYQWNGIGMVASFELFAVFMIGLTFIEIIFLCIMPAVSFKYFNKRSHMDTLGGLPLTTRQRFFGDMLSGAASFGFSFIPGAVIAIVIAAMTETGPMREMYSEALTHGNISYYAYPWGTENTLELFTIYLITELICYAAAYAIACFITSCCGKTGTSALFSLITVTALTLITYPAARYIYECTVGYDAYTSAIAAMSAVPPIGTLIQLIMKLFNIPGSFAATTPLILIAILIIALFALGAYYAAMKRKTERVDREFVFGSGYYIIPAMITVAAGMFGLEMIDIKTIPYTIPAMIIVFFVCLVIALLCIGLFKKKWKGISILAVIPVISAALAAAVSADSVSFHPTTFSLPLILIALGSCMVIAYLRRRSVMDIPKGAAVFAAALSACFMFGVIVKSTDGFGLSYRLPSKQSIESVEISGNMIQNKFDQYDSFNDSVTIKSDSGIELVLSEHQKLIDDIRNYESSSINNFGDTINLVYHYKNGLTSYRSYVYLGEYEVMTDRSDYRLVEAISRLPELHDMTLFGILENPDMPCISMTYNGRDPGNINDPENASDTSLMIKPSEHDRFIKICLEDISAFAQDNPYGFHKVGEIYYDYLDKDGKHRSYRFPLYQNYENIINFLNDRDNIENSADISIDETKQYSVTFNIGGNGYVSFTITRPELAREFLSYLQAGYTPSGNDTEQNNISIYDNEHHRYSVKSGNEQEALKALIKAIRAHQQIKP